MRIIILLSTLFYLSSCTSYKEIQYLQGNIDSTKYSQFKVPEQKIQRGDQISISVFSDNAAASALFNAGGAVQQQAAGSSQMAAVNAGGSVYDVDQDGNIFSHKWESSMWRD